MKELSIEEKARRYDEAKYIMREYIESGNAGVIAENTIKKAFPELSESEDEKIRKKLLEYFKSFTSETFFNGVPTSDAIAWLEKQGENTYNKELSELLHKVICRFINDPDIPYSDREKVSMEVLPYVERLEKQGNANKEYWRGYREGKQEILDKYAEFEKQGEQKPDTNCLLSWSETDEKMLQSLEGIVKDYWAKAEQEKNEIKIREASNVSYFLKTIQKSPLCWIKCSDKLPNRDGIYLVVTDGMHNDVYDMARYDSIDGWHKASEIIYWMPIPQLNNKSIIEQKPAENEELTEFDKAVGVSIGTWNPKTPEQIQSVKAVSKKLLKLAKKQINDEQKVAWSEEDEKIYQSIMDDTVQENQLNSNQTNWLRDIKYRYFPQPKQEWSEEDEGHIYTISNILEDRKNQQTEVGIKILDKEIAWLNSLKDRVPLKQEYVE